MLEKYKKYHWYSFAFRNESHIKSVSMAQDNNFVTSKNIINAKMECEAASNSIMISCCYLGHMTVKTYND